ncbi:hypothetical protein FD13_GL000993 [Levilactobacillus senmaizukei DSM 21775 = NBRC 103853]|uniref:Gram-positive cocci surface proteins LPxTG domain-containing protein n=1 Tax=Levilactobacillus senmaizukei DSM 21775 = NBRC 103853 TaxID=1423803 RepID=A0A0R2DMX0_9LACO|nr:LPXTG cell wall anchor domain-containing protein [Levilactobacillus senmaizukei]KRN01530.1 hypothetical protein FD13_GL000993 [Levilactobacillus senmaizukei DSM 21775 = NBRC 103853]
MQLGKKMLLILGLLIVGWGTPMTAHAASQSTGDAQKSQYSVTLTPNASSGSDGDLVGGGDGDSVLPDDDSNGSNNHSKPTTTATSGGDGDTVAGQPTQHHFGLAGRLPQTSETWFGIGTMTGIILLLLIWIAILTRRRKAHN